MSTNNSQPSTPTKSGARRTNALPSSCRLDEYRIDAILGAGGFGITYKALDTHLDAWVAIKEYFPVEWSFRDADGVTVHPNTQGQSSAGGGAISDYEWGLERFLDEARVLARVQHPYVVRVKRYFRANGTAYIVMEYEEGEPLSTILDESGTLGEAEVRGLLEDVLPALQAVHDQGYLHRDIKPANLYVRSRDQRVMLIDFGAARAAISRHSQNVTSLVTPGYSPPEQYTTRNDRYGTWTDIYALGAVLYRCVTGHTPAEAADRLLDDHLESAVLAGSGRYSPNLLRVIDRALAVRPEMRFRDVAEMQTALAEAHDIDSDSDDTIIMAPVTKTSQPAHQPTLQPVAHHLPPATAAAGQRRLEPARPAIESPPVIGQRQTLPRPAANTAPSPRRLPTALLAGGAAVLAVAVLATTIWLWPSAPEPSLPPDSPASREQPGPLPDDRLAPPSTPAPEAGTSDSTATALPPPISPAEAPSAVETAPAEQSAAPSTGVPPPIVETTVREPAPVTESGSLPSASQPPASLPERQDQLVQPVSPPTEPVSEPPPTATTVPPVPAPTLAPRRIKPRVDTPVEPAAPKQRDANKAAPARPTSSARSQTPRKKERRSRSRSQPAVATPAAPTRSAPPASGASNPWEPPASTGFNQK